MMMRNPVIGIIGIRGRYGQWLEKFFTDRGYRVIGSDLGTEITNEEVVRRAQVIIFSVSISQTVSVVESVLALSRPEQLFMDITSIKGPVIKAMLKSEAEVVGLHPMCAPTVQTWRGQTVVYHPARLEKWQNWVEDFLQSTEGRIEKCAPEKHDKNMAAVQVLPHALILVLATVLRKGNIDIDEVMDYASPFYRIVLSLMGRILSQDANLYCEIQLNNPFTADVLDALEKEMKSFRTIIEQKDIGAFRKDFEASRAHLGQEQLDTAFSFFNDLIRLMADFAEDNTIIIITKQDRPGILHKITGMLAEAEINLAALHTQKLSQGQYKFLISFEKRLDELDDILEKIKAMPEIESITRAKKT